MSAPREPGLDAVREALPEAAIDLRINLQSVLGEGALSPLQRWAVAVACAHASRAPDLARALAASARIACGADADALEAALDDALAAAALMAMNNVYYRFRHLSKNAVHRQLPARLRMQRLVRTRGTRSDFELFCLAVSAIGGCEACIRAHEEVLERAGVGVTAIHDAIRIAATVHGVAAALEMAAAFQDVKRTRGGWDGTEERS